MFASPKEVVARLINEPIIAFDWETSGLDSFLEIDTYCLAIGTSDYCAVIITGMREVDPESGEAFVSDQSSILKEFKELFNYYRKNNNTIWVAHNAAYDLPLCFKYGFVPKHVHCTMTTERMLNNGLDLPAGLYDTALRHLGIEVSKEEREDIAQRGIDSVEKIQYAANDVFPLIGIYNSQMKAAETRVMIKDVKLHGEYELVNAYLEFCGIGFDVKRHEYYYRSAEHREWSYLMDLNNMLKEEWGEEKYNEYVDSTKHGYIEWTNAQAIEILKDLGVTATNYKTGKPTCDIKFLRKKIDDHPIVSPYIEMAQARKIVTTYGREFARHVRADGRIHTRFRPFVETGRTSCGDSRRFKSGFPNVQNQPNDADFRRCFTSAGKSYRLIGADFSSQEARVLAELSKEPTMLEFFKSGSGDMHSYIAKQLYPDLIASDMVESEVKKKFPDLRRKAKAATFALQYGGSHYTLAGNLNIPTDMAKDIYDRYFRTFRRLRMYHKRARNQMRQLRYIKCCSVTGRKRFIRDASKLFEGTYDGNVNKIMRALDNQVVNNIIQGSSATMTKMAMIWLFRWIMDNKKFNKVKMVLMVHDEIVLECYHTYAEEVASKLKYFMEAAAKVILSDLDCAANPWIGTYYQK